MERLDSFPRGVIELLDMALGEKTKRLLEADEDAEKIVREALSEANRGSVEPLDDLIRRRLMDKKEKG